MKTDREIAERVEENFGDLVAPELLQDMIVFGEECVAAGREAADLDVDEIRMNRATFKAQMESEYRSGYDHGYEECRLEAITTIERELRAILYLTVHSDRTVVILTTRLFEKYKADKRCSSWTVLCERGYPRT